jgi:hypothetical protein
MVTVACPRSSRAAGLLTTLFRPTTAAAALDGDAAAFEQLDWARAVAGRNPS